MAEQDTQDPKPTGRLTREVEVESTVDDPTAPREDDVARQRSTSPVPRVGDTWEDMTDVGTSGPQRRVRVEEIEGGSGAGGEQVDAPEVARGDGSVRAAALAVHRLAMLCKLLTCHSEAVERRIVPYGTVNVCAIHAQEFDWWSEGDFRRDDILRELMFACRFGPREDPPLNVSMRGRDYETGYKAGTE